MFKKIFKQVARPFQYAAKTGSKQTHQKGRHNIGGQVTNAFSTVKLKVKDTIVLSNFENYLNGKGLPDEAINFFSCLKFVQSGQRQQRDFTLNRSNAKVQRIGMAVERIDQNTIKIAIVWNQFTVTFQEPQIVINYVTSHYGPGWRNSNDHSQTIGRGLSHEQLQNVKNRLENLVKGCNSGIEAKNMLE